MADRVSQEVVEVAYNPTPAARITQVAVEILRQTSPPTSAGLTQLAIEVLGPTPVAADFYAQIV